MDNISTLKYGDYQFKVLPFEVDFRCKLKLPHITNYILNSSGYHADFCNYGMDEMNKRNCSWVLMRIAIEMFEYPKMYEKIRVKTWCEGFVKFYFKRNYEFRNSDGKIIGYARTIWVVIDNETRKPVDMTNLLNEDYIADIDCPIESQGRIQSIPENDKGKFEFKVKYSDIDMNQHLNSCKYVEHVMDGFTLHKFERRDVKRFEIDFLNESLFADNITMHKLELPDNTFIIELRNEENKKICKSKIIFSEKVLNESYHPGIHKKD